VRAGVRAARECLLAAARLRAASVLFAPPRPGLPDELRGLAAPLGEGARGRILDLAALAGPDLEEEYHRVFAPAGPCSTGESDYEASCLAGKGPLLADVAGFYRAFSFNPSLELRESPDHVAVELSFAAFLKLKEAHAAAGGMRDEARTCRDAFGKFRREHLDRLLSPFLGRLGSSSAGGFYAAAALAAPGLAASGYFGPHKYQG